MEARVLRPKPARRVLPTCEDRHASERDPDCFDDYGSFSNYVWDGTTANIEKALGEARECALMRAEALAVTLAGGVPQSATGASFVEWHKEVLEAAQDTASSFREMLRVAEARAKRHEDEGTAPWVPPPEIVCPVTRRVMQHPVLAADGRTVVEAKRGPRHKATMALVRVHYDAVSRELAFTEAHFAPVCARIQARELVPLEEVAGVPHEANKWRARFNKTLAVVTKVNDAVPFVGFEKAVQRLPRKLERLAVASSDMYHAALVQDSLENARTFACVLSGKPADMLFMDGEVYNRAELVAQVEAEGHALKKRCSVEEAQDKRYSPPAMHRRQCPITLSFAQDPVVMKDGIIYEREAIAAYLKKHRLGTMDRSFKLHLCDVKTAPTPSFLQDIEPEVEASAGAILRRWRGLGVE